eukprot:TRINITY_DN10557_c0_g1_i1.p1 TRINITY_DN10557_c0_g1~~TRINITY_DN10557_c0_g1_i1.p1  ORF type:complete len:174 (-),score=31.53 TRINITY_DN10557_c0_g1_i1:70-570(-)
MKVLFLILISIALALSLQVQFPIVLLYNGACDPWSRGAACHGVATSELITTHINANAGAKTSVSNVIGARSRNFGNATYTGSNSYTVYGNVTYGVFDEHAIYYSSLNGFCIPNCTHSHAIFIDTGVINGGLGAYKNATGTYSAIQQPFHGKPGVEFWFNALVTLDK